MVAYADLVLPDTTYLERWDCISLLDRPISDADGPADAIRQPVVAPDRDVRAVPGACCSISARGSSCRASSTDDGAPRYPGGYADYIVHHERAPGIGSLAGLRGADGERARPRRAQSEAARAYIANGCFYEHELPPEQRYFKHANRAYLDWARGWASSPRLRRSTFQLYVEPLQKLPPGRAGALASCTAGAHRERVANYFDPLPFWYPPFEDGDRRPIRSHAITQRPMRDVPFLGLAERLAAPDPRPRIALHASRTGRARSASPTATGCGSKARSAASRPRPADGRRQPRHGVDVECHRRRVSHRIKLHPPSVSG